MPTNNFIDLIFATLGTIDILIIIPYLYTQLLKVTVKG